MGTVKEEVLALLPQFSIFINGNAAGYIKKELSLFRPVFTLNYRDWTVRGDILSWDYRVTTRSGQLIMTAAKQLLRMTDTYIIDVQNQEDSLLSMMIVLAIDAAKCSGK